jgi:glycosyltransferase involved in cell wall biosynthesis
VHSLNPGGTERLAVDMALAFASRYQVQVICLDEPGLWAGELRRQGIRVTCLWRQPGFDPLVVLHLARLLRRDRIDLVHAHQCTPWFYAALSRLLHGRPRLLLEEHGRFHPEVHKPLRIGANRLLLRRLTHAFVAVSADIRDRLVSYEGLQRKRIRVIYNGAPSALQPKPAERQLMRQQLGYGAGDLVIGSVGRLDPIKNLPLLLRAFNVLRNRHPEARLLIIGDGPERDNVECLIRELGLWDFVKLAGFRNDARRLHGAMDLFTMTSFSEGTSMALLEAMSSGLPIAASAVGGNTEILSSGQSGLLFASNDTEAAAAAFQRLASDAHLRDSLGRAARREFEARFSFETMIGEYRSLYGALLGRGA